MDPLKIIFGTEHKIGPLILHCLRGYGIQDEEDLRKYFVDENKDESILEADDGDPSCVEKVIQETISLN